MVKQGDFVIITNPYDNRAGVPLKVLYVDVTLDEKWLLLETDSKDSSSFAWSAAGKEEYNLPDNITEYGKYVRWKQEYGVTLFKPKKKKVYL